MIYKIERVLGLVLAFILLPVAFLILGQLGTGVSSYWYGINNPNNTAYNYTTGAVNSNGTINASAPGLMEQIVIPIITAMSVFIVVILSGLRFIKRI
jgi:hypothetical protein